MKIPTTKAITTWKPSENQMKILEIAVNSTSEKIGDWFKEAKLERVRWNGWIKNDKFVEWWNREWERAMRVSKAYLDKVGMELAPVDFRYWEVMQKKYGGYTPDNKAQGGVNILFNIPRPPEVQIIDGDTDL